MTAGHGSPGLCDRVSRPAQWAQIESSQHSLAARDSFHNPGGFERKEKLNLKDLSIEKYNPEIP